MLFIVRAARAGGAATARSCWDRPSRYMRGQPRRLRSYAIGMVLGLSAVTKWHEIAVLTFLLDRARVGRRPLALVEHLNRCTVVRRGFLLIMGPAIRHRAHRCHAPCFLGGSGAAPDTPQLPREPEQHRAIWRPCSRRRLVPILYGMLMGSSTYGVGVQNLRGAGHLRHVPVLAGFIGAAICLIACSCSATACSPYRVSIRMLCWRDVSMAGNNTYSMRLSSAASCFVHRCAWCASTWASSPCEPGADDRPGSSWRCTRQDRRPAVLSFAGGDRGQHV